MYRKLNENCNKQKTRYTKSVQQWRTCEMKLKEISWTNSEMFWNRAGGRTPRTSRSGGGPHACSGASCCVGEPFWAHKMRKICWSPGLQRSPDPLAGGEGLRGGFAAPSQRTPLTILSLCLSCVYVHTCMKMHCYFLLNVKRGASQLYLGASNYLAPALFWKIALRSHLLIQLFVQLKYKWNKTETIFSF